MLRIKRILFPTDFSPASDSALATACHWARTFDGDLHLLHVMASLRADLYPAALGSTDSTRAYLSLAENVRDELDTRCRIAHNQGARVTSHSVEGLAAAPAILDFAEAQDFDLIAMSTHGRRGFRRLLLGSVAEELVQRSICPVLTVAESARSAVRLWPQRILVAVDLSEHSAAPLAYAKHLAKLFRAELQLLHVIVRPSLPAYYDGTPLPLMPWDSQTMEKEAQAALEALCIQGEPAGPVSLHVERGVAPEQILRFAVTNSSELIVVASHGLTGVSHLLMGSVSERVVREAPCPVLTIKSFGKALLPRSIAATDQSAGEKRNGGQRLPPQRPC